MSKRHCLIFSVFLLITIALTACNRTAEKSDKGTPTPSVTETPTPSPFPLTTLPPAPTPVPLKEVALSQRKFEECTVIDCEDYYFEVLSFKEQDDGGYAIETLFDNRQEFAMTLVISDVYVNLLMPTLFDLKYYDWGTFVYSYDGEEKVIEPGEKKTIEFWISDAYAKRLNISDVSDLNCVQFVFTVEAADETVFDYCDMNWMVYYRYGRENVKPYEHVLNDTDIVLLDREDVKLYLTDFIYDEDGSCYVYFYWENNTTALLYYNFYQRTINGYERRRDLDYFEEMTLGSGMGNYDFFILSASDVEKSGNTSVTEFKFDVNLYYDAGIWQWEDIVDETFTVYPSEHRAVKEEKYEPFSENILLFDTDYYKMVYNGFSTESRETSEGKYTDYYIQVSLENKSAQTLQFVVKDATFNGEGFSNEYNYRSLSPGESKEIKFRWEEQGPVFRGFPKLKSLALSVQIKNMDDEKQSVVFEETVVVNP